MPADISAALTLVVVILFIAGVIYFKKKKKRRISGTGVGGGHSTDTRSLPK